MALHDFSHDSSQAMTAFGCIIRAVVKFFWIFRTAKITNLLSLPAYLKASKQPGREPKNGISYSRIVLQQAIFNVGLGDKGKNRQCIPVNKIYFKFLYKRTTIYMALFGKTVI